MVLRPADEHLIERYIRRPDRLTDEEKCRVHDALSSDMLALATYHFYRLYYLELAQTPARDARKAEGHSDN